MQGIFDPRWITHHRATVDSAALGGIRVTRRTGQGEWSPETGMSGGSELVLFEGKARWQKFGATTKRDYIEDFAQFQRTRVQVSIAEVAAWCEANGIDKEANYFHPGDKVELIDNPSNPDSDGSVSYIWGDPTSSNAWHYTFITQENEKQVG